MLYCLNALDAQARDLSLVVFSSYGPMLPAGYQGDLRGLGIPSERFISVNHHTSHAYAAYCLSPFDAATVVVVDGEGNLGETESVFHATRSSIERVLANDVSMRPAIGIGRTYEAFANFLGWVDQEAGKVMALAPFGDASPIDVPLFEFSDGQVRSALRTRGERGVADLAARIQTDFGEPYARGGSEGSRVAAAYVQGETERILPILIEEAIARTGQGNVCMSGGVALNCAANARVLESRQVRDLFVLPASSDKGQASGNALFGFHHLTGVIPKCPMSNDFFGRPYNEREILAALERRPEAYVGKQIPTRRFEYFRDPAIAETVASLLAENRIVAWFQGGSELGPRALGNRSLLASPIVESLRDQLNVEVKKREAFRPFAPACLAEKQSDFFVSGRPEPYMSVLTSAREDRARNIPGVVHVDRTARLQTVTREGNSGFYDLIRAFERRTGVPVVLNTSFNVCSPIVEHPGSALATFLSSKIDALAIENYLIVKR